MTCFFEDLIKDSRLLMRVMVAVGEEVGKNTKRLFQREMDIERARGKEHA